VPEFDEHWLGPTFNRNWICARSGPVKPIHYRATADAVGRVRRRSGIERSSYHYRRIFGGNEYRNGDRSPHQQIKIRSRPLPAVSAQKDKKQPGRSHRNYRAAHRSAKIKLGNRLHLPNLQISVSRYQANLCARSEERTSEMRENNPVVTRLTIEQRLIARLFTLGLPRKEIAQMVGVTQRTIEYHLDQVQWFLGAREKEEMKRAIIRDPIYRFPCSALWNEKVRDAVLAKLGAQAERLRVWRERSRAENGGKSPPRGQLEWTPHPIMYCGAKAKYCGESLKRISSRNGHKNTTPKDARRTGDFQSTIPQIHEMVDT